MRVLICGGRDFADRTAIFEALNELREKIRAGWWPGGGDPLVQAARKKLNAADIDVIIHGAARGADSMAGWWARSKDIPEEKYLVKTDEWTRFGDAAGPMRNRRMLLEGKPDVVCAFPGARGTIDMLNQAQAHRVPAYCLIRPWHVAFPFLVST